MTTYKLEIITDEKLRDGLSSVKIRTNPPRYTLTSKLYATLSSLVRGLKTHTNLISLAQANDIFPIVGNFPKDEQSVIKDTLKQESQVEVYVRKYYKLSPDIPVNGTVDLTFEGETSRLSFDGTSLLLRDPKPAMTILKVDAKSSTILLFNIERVSPLVLTVRSMILIKDSTTVYVPFTQVFGSSHWYASDHQLSSHLGVVTCYDAIYGKMVKNIHALRSSDLLWKNAHCLVSFSDIGVSGVAPEDSILYRTRLYINNPRTLFVFDVNSEPMSLSAVHVETRVDNVYKQYLLDFQLRVSDSTYAIVLESSSTWTLSVRFHVERATSTRDHLYVIREIEVLYENVDVEYIQKNAISYDASLDHSALLALADTYPLPDEEQERDDDATSSASTSTADDLPPPPEVFDYTQLPSSYSYDMYQNDFSSFLPGSPPFYEEERSQRQRTQSYEHDLDDYDNSFLLRIGDRLKKKRYHKLTAHLVEEPKKDDLSHEQKKLDVHGLSVRVESRLVKFVETNALYIDYIAYNARHPLEIRRGHRYLLRFDFVLNSRHESVEVNLKLRRHRPRRSYPEDEYYKFVHHDLNVVMHFKKETFQSILLGH